MTRALPALVALLMLTTSGCGVVAIKKANEAHDEIQQLQRRVERLEKREEQRPYE